MLQQLQQEGCPAALPSVCVCVCVGALHVCVCVWVFELS